MMNTDRRFNRLCWLTCILASLPFSRALTLNTPIATPTSASRCLAVQTVFPSQFAYLQYEKELRVRQQTTELATCGYINGASSFPVTCGPSLYCATTSTYVGCCELSNCRDIFTACYDLLGETCDQACQNNPANLVCRSSLPYCAEYRYEGGSTGFGCAGYDGYTSTVLLSIATDLPTLSTPGPDPNVTVTVPPSTPTDSDNNDGDGGGLSTGATAGIAVGATLVGVGLIGLAWFLVRRRKKKPSSETPIESKVAQPNVDNRASAYSELAAKPTSPTVTPQTPYFPQNPQSSPGINGPPQYSQHYDGQVVEMPDTARPTSYPATELSSNKYV